MSELSEDIMYGISAVISELDTQVDEVKELENVLLPYVIAHAEEGLNIGVQVQRFDILIQSMNCISQYLAWLSDGGHLRGHDERNRFFRRLPLRALAEKLDRECKQPENSNIQRDELFVEFK